MDGYDLGTISVVLPLITSDLHLSAAWSGLIGASTLIGIFLGGPIFGAITDLIGRKATFTVDLMIFVAAAAVQVISTAPALLLGIRLLLGLAIGAEYSVGAAMLSEFVPARTRGKRIAGLEVSWYAGYVLAVVVAYGLRDFTHLPWNWILATGTIPALACLILRVGIPESPRWLLRHGREQEARAVIDTYIGSEHYDAEGFQDEQATSSGHPIRSMFAPRQRTRTIFACVFYSCLVAPYFAIFTFAPEVLSTVGLGKGGVGTISINFLAGLGALTGLFVIERVGRRKLLIIPFWIMTASLITVGLWHNGPSGVIIAAFVTFAFINAAANDLTPVYPPELFPTAIRTSGTGLATAASRIGAALGTFVLPIGLSTIGIGPSMLVGAAITLTGAITSQLYAPETTGKTLTSATHTDYAGPPHMKPA